MDKAPENLKPLRVTVAPRDAASPASFGSRAARLFQHDARIEAAATRDGLTLSCVWFLDLEFARQRITESLPGDYAWGAPEIEYRSERVAFEGRERNIVLEPILLVEVSTPADFVGYVIGDLSSRRGLIRSQSETSGSITITAEVPLSELSSYVSELKERTHGTASASATFLKYDDRPSGLRARALGLSIGADDGATDEQNIAKPRDEPPYCSFCGAGKNNVKHMVAGPDVHICDECITACRDIINTGKSGGGAP